MLQRIHERITGWIAGVIIALVAGAFMLFGVQYYFQQSASEHNVAATVNGDKITHQEVNTVYTQMLRRTMAQMGGQSLPDAYKQQIKNMALQSLITNTALLTTLKNEGFRVGDAQIKNIIASAPEFQQDGHFSQSHFQQVLMQADLTPMGLFDRIKSNMILNQLTQGIAASVFVLPNEVSHMYQISHQKRSFGYLRISQKSLLNTVNVTDKMIADYYQSHKDAFKTPAKAKVQYVVLSPEHIAKSINISVAQAKAYYESNLMNYQVPARWKVEQATLPVEKNASTAAVNKVKADAEKVAMAWRKGQAPKGAATMTLSSVQVPDKLAATLSAMTVNQVSAPLRTQNGFTLLKMVEKTAKKTRSFESVEKNIITMLQRQQVNQALSQKVSQLADLTYTNPDSLEPAAKALKLSIQASGLIEKTGEKTGIFSNQKVLQAVFGDTVYRDGNNSDPIALPDGRQIVVRVIKKIPSQQKALSEVKSEIKNTLMQDKLKAKAGVLAYQVQNALLNGESPAVLAKKYHTTWHYFSSVMGDSAQLKNIPQIVKTTFSTPVSAFQSINKKPVGVNTVLLQSGDYAVIAIDQVSTASKTQLTSSRKSQMSDALVSLYSQLLQHYFVASVVNASKIVVEKSK